MAEPDRPRERRTGGPRGRPRGPRGPELLAVARTEFLEQGFARTTMDSVATRARISKSSLYREHPSKDELFAAVVADWADRGRGAMDPHLERLLATGDLRSALVVLTTTIQAAVLDPEVLQMRRLVTSEAERVPRAAAIYLVESWDRNIGALGDALAQLAEQGLLELDDPQAAAHQLTWLAVGGLLNERLLRAGTPDATRLDAAGIASAAVDTFLARYARDPRKHAAPRSGPTRDEAG